MEDVSHFTRSSFEPEDLRTGVFSKSEDRSHGLSPPQSTSYVSAGSDVQVEGRREG